MVHSKRKDVPVGKNGMCASVDVAVIKVSGYMWHVGGWGRIGCSHGLICYSKGSAMRKVTRREAEGDSVRSQFIFTLNMSKSSLQS